MNQDGIIVASLQSEDWIFWHLEVHHECFLNSLTVQLFRVCLKSQPKRGKEVRIAKHLCYIPRLAFQDFSGSLYQRLETNVKAFILLTFAINTKRNSIELKASYLEVTLPDGHVACRRRRHRDRSRMSRINKKNDIILI